MARHRSIESDQPEADERSVRSFLEHAAPVILESRALDNARFEAVSALADQHGLTRDQLACELRLLQQRGVITSAPWERLEETAAGATDTPPGEVAPDLAADRSAPPTSASPAVASPEPSDAATPERVEISTTESAVAALRQRAVKILARRGSIGPSTARKLEKAGQQAGLSKAQIAAVLDAVRTPAVESAAPPDRSAAPPPAGASASAPPAPPKPAADALPPSERFRRWIHQKLSGYPSTLLAVDDENGLIGVGVHRYHLAQVLATHMVRDVATERSIRLERDLESASCNSTVGTSAQAAADDRKLQEFFEEVAPILTQHRGINAKSRIMMNAVADRIGLTPDELERALATLQHRLGDPDEEDPRQLERRESFRAYLRRTMAQLPHGIVTFKTHWRLCQAGEHFHGVTPKWIEPTIKEVAAEIGARFISKQQALDHVDGLVEEQLTDRPVIDNTTRSRIYTEGTQWGLEPVDVDAVIRERTESLRRQLAAERRRTRWVVNFVIGGLVIVGVILAGMFLSRPAPSAATKGDAPAPAPDERPKAPRLRGMPWWDDTLRVAQARLRVICPDLRPDLDRLIADQPSARRAAYESLIARLADKPDNWKLEKDARQLLVSLHALEPSDAAARAIGESLLAAALALDDQLPDSPATLQTMFRDLKTVVAMVKDPDTPPLRRNRLIEQLDAVTQIKGDRLLDEPALWSSYSQGLAQRLYDLLIRLAAEDPARAGNYYTAIQKATARTMDEGTLEQCDIEFLTAILSAGDTRWDRYGDAIRRVSRSADPLVVLKLLGIYRRTDDERLRYYLAGLFFDRLRAAPGELTEREMIDAVRESLGVASRERDYRRWQLLVETASALLERKHVDRTNPDVLVQEALELAHASTLACALSRGDAGGPAFDELQKAGPVRLPLTGGPWSGAKPTTYKSDYPVSRVKVLKSNINSLVSARTPAQRISLLPIIANQVESVPDIELESGQTLAQYLVRSRSDEREYRQALEYIERLGRWNAVRLGLADSLLDLSQPDARLGELYAKLLGKTARIDTPADRQQLRSQLLADVLQGLSAEPAPDADHQHVFQQAAQALRKLYARQAEWLGVPEDRYRTARQPSAVLVAMIEFVAERLRGSAITAADRPVVDTLAYRLKAAEFLAVNDLQYTAALQRLWLQLLAIQLAQTHPDKADQIGKLRREFSGGEQPAPRAFEQLRNVQQDLLRLWMQLQPEFDEAEIDAFNA